MYLQRAFEELLQARGDILGLTELKAHDSHCAKRLYTFSWSYLKITLSHIQDSRIIVCNNVAFSLLN